MAKPDLQAIVDRIDQLPELWHQAGSLSTDVLRVLAEHAAARTIDCSMETGVGKSTLLLSHLSHEHWVFTLDHAESMSMTRDCPVLRQETVRFVEGPTQLTLRYAQLPELQLALIDGPHGYPFPELEYYAIYPRLLPGALLVIDDIHIPTVRQLFDFVAEDAMFELLEVVRTTAFLKRTDAPTFDPTADGWNRQNYNRRRFPIREPIGRRLQKGCTKVLRRFGLR